MDAEELFVHKSRWINAAKKGEDSVIEEYLSDASLGVTVSTTDSLGETALHWAARAANVNAQDKSQETPLHKAAFRNQAEAVAELVTRGADVSVRNKDGKTPLDLATDFETKKELLPKEQGADEDTYEREDEDSD